MSSSPHRLLIKSPLDTSCLFMSPGLNQGQVKVHAYMVAPGLDDQNHTQLDWLSNYAPQPQAANVQVGE